MLWWLRCGAIGRRNLRCVEQHICATCRQPLSHVQPSDGAPGFWKHGVEPVDHPAAPVPRREMDEEHLKPVCDFCTTPGNRETSWVYPTQPFEVQDEDTGQVFNIDDGQGWGACAACHKLIQTGNPDALAARSATLREKRNPGVRFEKVLEPTRAAHETFFLAYTGAPPVPATEYRPT